GGGCYAVPQEQLADLGPALLYKTATSAPRRAIRPPQSKRRMGSAVDLALRQRLAEPGGPLLRHARASDVDLFEALQAGETLQAGVGHAGVAAQAQHAQVRQAGQLAQPRVGDLGAGEEEGP